MSEAKTPSDIKKLEIIWKLKKPLHGINDTSIKLWLKVKAVFSKIGLRKLVGDEALYFKNDKNGDLDIMISTHIDDFNLEPLQLNSQVCKS